MVTSLPSLPLSSCLSWMVIFFSYFVDACYVYTQRSSKLSWTCYPVRGCVFEVKSERGKGGWLMHVSGFVPWRREFSVNLQEARHRWEKYGSSVRLSFGGNTSQIADIWICVFFKGDWNVYRSSVLMFSWNKFNWLNFIFPNVKKVSSRKNILKYLFQKFFLSPYILHLMNSWCYSIVWILFIIEICSFILMVFWHRYSSSTECYIWKRKFIDK